MPTTPVPFHEIRRTVDAWHEALDAGWAADAQRGKPSALTVAAGAVGLAHSSTAEVRLDTAVALGITVRQWHPIDPAWADEQLRRYQRYDDDFVAASRAFVSAASVPPAVPSRPRGGRRVSAPPDQASLSRPAAPPPAAPTSREIADKLPATLRRTPRTLDELVEKLGAPASAIVSALDLAHADGLAVAYRSGRWHLDDAPAIGSQVEHPYELVSDGDGVIRFAAIGDTHLGSKYSREDCLGDFYDRVVRRGIARVLHAGNWIDGEINFNKHDLMVHGMDQQMQYLAKNYPRRLGVETWAITGEDHEGWYSRREGVDVGRYAENVMRQNGRTDWHNLGFMECFVPLVHGGTGKSSQLCLMHPGGGSAYAISYAPQKIVEGFDGGDKPAVLLLGHYHKASYNLIRNVHTVQVGCFQDQTLFMRKSKLAAHLAGCFVELVLDPDTGAVTEFNTAFRNYFVRDYYRNRWSQHGPVEHVRRSS